MKPSHLCLLLAALASSGQLLEAKPYFYWDAESQVAPPPPEPTINPDKQLHVQQLLQQQLQEQQQAQQQQQQQQQQPQQAPSQPILDQQQQQPQQPDPQIQHRIQGHLNELVSHGSTAMRGVVDSVQPDLSNIRKDLGEVYQATRENVGKRIEPLAQTVRPYLDHAQKVVAPYVNSAREEVPRLIQQAGPALHKVGEHVREKIHGALEKLNPDQSAAAAASKATSAAQKGIAQAADKVADTPVGDATAASAPSQ